MTSSGRREDQFFGTVFLGSGLRFIGGVFAWVAAIATTHASPDVSPDEFAESTLTVFLIKVMGSEEIDRAISLRGRWQDFLTQDRAESFTLAETQKALLELVGE